jgi:hypothetical protein
MSIRCLGFGLLVGAVSSLLTTSAFAEAPATAAPAAESAPSANSGADIVRLKNGGVVRGKISELLPGSSVTIVSASGKTHEFQMTEVSYAGPESQDPTAAAAPAAPPPPAPPKPKPAAASEWSNQSSNDAKPYVTVHGAQANLHLESDPPGLTFHREASSAIAFGRGGVAHATGYERLCTSPCDISLPAGTETLALSKDGKSPVEAGSVSFPAGDSQILGSYQSNTGIRVAGVVIIVASAVAGGALIFTSSKDGSCDSYGYCSKTLDTTQLALGTVVLAGGSLLGIGLVMVSDSGSVQVAPRGQTPLPEPNARLRLPGLALRSTF